MAHEELMKRNMSSNSVPFASLPVDRYVREVPVLNLRDVTEILVNGEKRALQFNLDIATFSMLASLIDEVRDKAFVTGRDYDAAPDKATKKLSEIKDTGLLSTPRFTWTDKSTPFVLHKELCMQMILSNLSEENLRLLASQSKYATSTKEQPAAT